MLLSFLSLILFARIQGWSKKKIPSCYYKFPPFQFEPNSIQFLIFPKKTLLTIIHFNHPIVFCYYILVFNQLYKVGQLITKRIIFKKNIWYSNTKIQKAFSCQKSIIRNQWLSIRFSPIFAWIRSVPNYKISESFFQIQWAKNKISVWNKEKIWTSCSSQTTKSVAYKIYLRFSKKKNSFRYWLTSYSQQKS